MVSESNHVPSPSGLMCVNPLGAIGVSLNKQKLIYNILAPGIIAIYKFLCTDGGSVYVNGAQRVKENPSGGGGGAGLIQFPYISCGSATYICMYIRTKDRLGFYS